jgi:hypothetical protein
MRETSLKYVHANNRKFLKNQMKLSAAMSATSMARIAVSHWRIRRRRNPPTRCIRGFFA